jgi:putative ABC transport system permease protein
LTVAFQQDLKQSLRGLRRTPGFTAVALLTLTLGIGASTAVFSVLQTLFLKPLPFADPERLVYLYTADPNKHFSGSRYLPLSAACYRDLEERQRTFTGVAAFQPRSYDLTGHGDAEHLRGLRVTGSFFELLGVRPAVGRVLQVADEHGPGVVVMTHGLWVRQFGGDRSILGRTVTLDGKGHTVVGVMPPAFVWPGQPQMFVADPPSPEELLEVRGTLAFAAVARLRAGVSPEQARAAMQLLNEELQREFPDAREWGIGTERLWEVWYGNRRAASGFLLLAGISVLAIACANLANLMISRAARRQREMALRRALGGGWRDVLLPFLTDGLVLSVAGGALGLLLAWELGGVLRSYVPPELLGTYGLDLGVLSFTLVLSVLATLLAGLVPSLFFSRLDLSASLREGDRAVGGRSHEWLRSALVCAQVALTLALLVSFGALWQSLHKLQQVPMGFRAEEAVAFTVRPNAQRYPDEAQQVAFMREVVSGLSGLPGVRAVGSVSATPMSGGASGDFIVPGRERESFSAHYRGVSPGAIDALGMTLQKGRGFDDGDCLERPESVIVSRSLAERCWPGEDPVGKTVVKKMYDDVGTAFRVVGVVEDVRLEGPAVDRGLETIYWPAYGVSWESSCRIVVRARGNPVALLPAIRTFMRRTDPDLPLTDIQTLGSVLDANLETSRTQATLMGLLAAIALGLAVAGIYGVMAYSVSQRRREIGIRKALGGQDWQVVWEIARRGMVLTALGLGTGAVLTAGLGRVLASQVYGVRAADPLSVAVAGLAFALVALAASLVPASRAARLDPVEVLRSE